MVVQYVHHSWHMTELHGIRISFIWRKLINYSCCSIIFCGIDKSPMDSLVSTIHILFNTSKRPFGEVQVIFFIKLNLQGRWSDDYMTKTLALKE